MQQNHKQYYNINKQILYKPFRNCWIKTSKRALGSSLHFLTVQRRLEWIILTIWIAQFILFLFCNEPTKNNYGIHTFTAKPPHFPLYKPICFSWTTPPPPPHFRVYILYGWPRMTNTSSLSWWRINKKSFLKG